MKNENLRFLSIIFMVMALTIYVSWGILFNVWIDIGLYAVVMPTFLFGLFGYILSMTDSDRPA